MTANEILFKKLEPGLEICSFAGLAQAFPVHFHNYYLIGCVLGGKRQLLAGNEKTPLTAGDLLCLNPGAIHGCDSKDGGNLYWLGLHISREYMLKLAKRATSRPFMPVFKKCVWPASPLAAAFEKMAADLGQNKFAMHAFLEKELPAILAWNETLAPANAHAANSAPFRELVALLRANPTASLSLAQMGAATGMDKYRLERAFKAAYGITPWRYLEALRVNLGQQMLNENHTIANTAVSCGFADQSHFARCFKARTGLTPGKYKKAALGAARA